MTKTFEKQLKALMQKDGGLEQVLAMYEGTTGSLLSTIEQERKCAIVQWYSEYNAQAHGYQNAEELRDTIYRRELYSHVDEMVRELGDEEFQAEWDFEEDEYVWHNLPEGVQHGVDSDTGESFFIFPG